MSPVLCLFFCLLLLNVRVRIVGGGRDPRAAISSDEVRGVQGAAPPAPLTAWRVSPKQWSSCSGSNTPTWHWDTAQAQIH